MPEVVYQVGRIRDLCSLRIEKEKKKQKLYFKLNMNNGIQDISSGIMQPNNHNTLLLTNPTSLTIGEERKSANDSFPHAVDLLKLN